MRRIITNGELTIIKIYSGMYQLPNGMEYSYRCLFMPMVM